jgi:hypothetical protein
VHRALRPLAQAPAWPLAAAVALTAVVTSALTAALIALGLLAGSTPGLTAARQPDEPAGGPDGSDAGPARAEDLEELPAHREAMARLRRIDENLAGARESAEPIPAMAGDVAATRQQIGEMHAELRETHGQLEALHADLGGAGDTIDTVDGRLRHALVLLERVTQSVESMDEKTGPNPRDAVR